MPEAGQQDNAQNLVVADDASIQFGTGDFTMALVARWKNNPIPRIANDFIYYSGYGAFLTKVEYVSPYTGLVLFANYPGVFVSGDASTRFAVQLDLKEYVVFSQSNHLNDSKFRLCLVRRQGTKLSIRIDGSQDNGIKVRPDLNLDALGSDLYLGGRRGQPVDGELAELALIKGEITDAETVGLERYFILKYALE